MLAILVSTAGLASADDGVPPRCVRGETIYVPCRGSGPMHMGSLHPTYRDCSEADLSKIDPVPWISN